MLNFFRAYFLRYSFIFSPSTSFIITSETVILWCEEATELQEADVDILDDRLRGKLDNSNLYYQLTFSFNPISASHWIKRKYWDYESEDIFKCQSTYLDNRFLDEN